MSTNTPSAIPLYIKLSELAEGVQDPDLRQFLRWSANNGREGAKEQARRDAELAEDYREATAEELERIMGIRYYLQRFHPARVGPDATQRLLIPVAMRLAELGYMEAAGEIQRAVAVSKGRSHEQAGLFVDLALGFLPLHEAT